jgi:hypothetical protein
MNELQKEESTKIKYKWDDFQKRMKHKFGPVQLINKWASRKYKCVKYKWVGTKDDLQMGDW